VHRHAHRTGILELVPHDVIVLIERANRDRAAGRTVDDAERTLEAMFTCSRKLAVYGTLAPGESNHHLLASCPGTWTSAAVPGRRTVRRFPAFTYDPSAALVAVQMLDSPDLPDQWQHLDAFEGPDYPRILVPVYTGDHLLAVANLYASREPVAPHETTAPASGPSRASPGTG
jgi:gamma-glutamylcyclotransferase (GGCT)/AIG2-like uncharacterized protein YtfP